MILLHKLNSVWHKINQKIVITVLILFNLLQFVNTICVETLLWNLAWYRPNQINWKIVIPILILFNLKKKKSQINFSEKWPSNKAENLKLFLIARKKMIARKVSFLSFLF